MDWRWQIQKHNRYKHEERKTARHLFKRSVLIGSINEKQVASWNKADAGARKREGCADWTWHAPQMPSWPIRGELTVLPKQNVKQLHRSVVQALQLIGWHGRHVCCVESTCLICVRSTCSRNVRPCHYQTTVIMIQTDWRDRHNNNSSSDQ